MSFQELVLSKRAILPIIPKPSTVADGTYIVTGANSGLGYECVKHFASLGASQIILAVRSLDKGNIALEKIRAETGRPDVGEVWELDLTSLDSVEAFSKRLNTLDRVDALIENAGIALDKFSLAGGVETTLKVNVISTVLLAVRAFPKLQESAKRFGITPHIVVVSSGAAFMANGILGGIDGNIFNVLSEEKASLANR